MSGVRRHDQRDRRQERHLRQRDAEVLGDVGVDQDDDEVVEGVHRPAQPRADERVALVGGQPAELTDDAHADPR
jgi:hypothetical protein